MALSANEQAVVNQVTTLSAEGKAAVAKGLSFIHRFSWTILVGGIIIGAVAEHFIGL